MKKRNYEKPSMKVVLLNKQPMLLSGSGVTSFSGIQDNPYYGSAYAPDGWDE